ncbi:beta-ketoacyl synthase chain length factor [Shewanella sp. 10N.286.45.A1]|uniref:beta-ketoacyl synthase chain length factor n=1 Tax=Shewanella sp. 10N.286.45.A1 TaxID=3229694 RepID=UPI00354C31B8
MKFSILSWGAWSPQYQHKADWQAWPAAISDIGAITTATPKLPQVPAMQRRRLSKLTKIILDSVFQCEPPAQCRSIFASQHGEINRTINLLNDIVDQSPLSPTAFSQSVHNTASGIYSILSQNQNASTSIAAGSKTLHQAFIEAYALLVDAPEPLLLSYADDTVPDIYQQFASEPEWPIAAAFVVAPSNAQHTALAQIDLKPILADVNPLTLGDILASIAQKKATSGNFSGAHWSLSFE